MYQRFLSSKSLPLVGSSAEKTSEQIFCLPGRNSIGVPFRIVEERLDIDAHRFAILALEQILKRLLKLHVSIR